MAFVPELEIVHWTKNNGIIAKNLPKRKVHQIPQVSDLKKKRFTGKIQSIQGPDSRQRNTSAESEITHFSLISEYTSLL